MGADESYNVSWPECWMQLRDMCYQEVLKLSGYWQKSGTLGLFGKVEDPLSVIKVARPFGQVL